MASTSNRARDLAIVNGRCLVPGSGLCEANIQCEDGVIASISAGMPARGASVYDARGAIVLPGIVDIHGDAFERQIMPRPHAVFPSDIAFLDTDRQLAANGITTAFHGITVSWEPGIRSLASAEALIAAIEQLEPRFGVDHRLHLRWETFGLDTIEAVIALFDRAKKPVLAFNDHTLPSMNGKRADIKLKTAAERALVDLDTYWGLMERAWTRRDEVPAGVARVAAAARANGVAMLSHDDRTVEERRQFRELGAVVAEFPMTEEALEEAYREADPVVLGAPNVVRGGSHNGAIDATSAVRTGRCSILASDYYYPAPLHAALKLAGDDYSNLESAWALVSRNPAQAAGLADRGDLQPGRRADLIVVADGAVRFVAVAGQPVFQR